VSAGGVDFLFCPLPLFGIDVRDYDRRPFFGKQLRGGESNPRRTACDNGAFVIQFAHEVSLSCRVIASRVYRGEAISDLSSKISSSSPYGSLQ
jgi:hypothetical protein